MAKKIKTILKLQIEAGAATPAPPVGPACGQAGINIMEFVQQFNAKTADKKGSITPVVIRVYEDRTFDFIIKTPLTSNLIKKALNVQKGSSEANKKKIGKLSREQITEIAKTKLPDLNARTIEAAIKVVSGTAKNMGVEVEQ